MNLLIVIKFKTWKVKFLSVRSVLKTTMQTVILQQPFHVVTGNYLILYLILIQCLACNFHTLTLTITIIAYSCCISHVKKLRGKCFVCRSELPRESKPAYALRDAATSLKPSNNPLNQQVKLVNLHSPDIVS